MKVLHIINNLGSGGAEKLLSEFLPLLKKNGDINIEVLLLTDEKMTYKKNLESKGIKVSSIGFNNINNPLNILKIKKHIEKNQYDIVHSHLFPSQYWVGITRQLTNIQNIKFVTTEHSNHNRRRNKSYFRKIDKYIYSKYDTVICITEKVKLNLTNWLNLKEKELDRYIVINNGVDINKYREAKPYKKTEICDIFTEETKLICMVSRFSQAKDHSTLIKSMKYLPDDVHLMLVGEGTLKENNQELVKELLLDKRVHFLGFRKDVERILKSSDIVVLSSHWEGLSLASIEGMASGRPFIASDVEGLSEIVKGAGLLFKEGNYLELSNIISKLLNNDNFYDEVSNRCFERVMPFNLDLMVSKTIKLYNSLVTDSF